MIFTEFLIKYFSSQLLHDLQGDAGPTHPKDPLPGEHPDLPLLWEEIQGPEETFPEHAVRPPGT